ncbi:hypothetical protein EYB26_005306 [Talaromyces marneffei]|uniref:uncharacterized protein n=1 Tax=Talaromyces marneffei TaxID=37727 RepID=UPI0012A964BA|nr:uncharacterized protein EYB26_005306 [Talaromyces marneffei]QGA17631.1 hypothetical protein EYB26_005306 [Talaromyces marneffei]
MDVKSEIIVVGAGWEFTLHATAFIAAGARITAYEMAPEKFGAGQIGLNMKDEILGFHNACRLAHLMPDFTPEHLERLPSEVKDIMNLPCHQALSKKRRSIKSKGNQAYRDLPDAEKMSKKEVVETKRSILEYMVAVGVLKVISQEVTVDMVASWLEKNKPVFLLTGSQLNLEKSGLNHLIGNPRFLKEFLMDSEDTKKFIEAVSDLQQVHTTSGCPSSALPRVGIVGGGSIALSCELDLGKILQPNLEIISISPEKRLRLPDSLLPTQENMTHRLIPGYVSDVVLCEDKNAIESVEIISFPGREIQPISTSLFVHIFNVYHPPGKWETPSRHAMESITKFLDDRAPENGLIRDYAIGPNHTYYDIVFRIDKPWFLSLEDDEVLIEKIKSLIEKDPDQATIIASGRGPMVNRLIWLADHLGYRGQFCQVALPTLDDRVAQLSEQLKSEGSFIRRPIQGRLKTAMINGEKITLEVHDSDGEPLDNVPDVDVLINAIGKSKRTPLINALKEKGYIHENDVAQDGPGIHPAHPMLSGHFTIFQRESGEDIVDSPGMWWLPEITKPKTEPDGWEKVFDLACRMVGKRA